MTQPYGLPRETVRNLMEQGAVLVADRNSPELTPKLRDGMRWNADVVLHFIRNSPGERTAEASAFAEGAAAIIQVLSFGSALEEDELEEMRGAVATALAQF